MGREELLFLPASDLPFLVSLHACHLLPGYYVSRSLPQGSFGKTIAGSHTKPGHRLLGGEEKNKK